MKNTSSISVLADQIKSCAERLSTLVYEVDSAEDGYRPEGYEELVDSQFYSELEFIQRAILMLTRLVTETRSDESAFAEGELDSKKEGVNDDQT